jgi:hypothetical protein
MTMSSLAAYRRNAVHVRTGLGGLDAQAGKLQVDGGQIRDANQMERFKRLAIPVRRALKSTDRVSFAGALQELQALQPNLPADLAAKIAAVAAQWNTLVIELDSTVNLGGRKLQRRAVLDGFLNAAAFYDQLEHDRARNNDRTDEYDNFIHEWGTAAEGLGAQVTEDAARVIVALDDQIAAALGEPQILPPPEKTPPPPPDPKEPLWKRIWTLIKPDSPG